MNTGVGIQRNFTFVQQKKRKSEEELKEYQKRYKKKFDDRRRTEIESLSASGRATTSYMMPIQATKLQTFITFVLLIRFH